MPRIRTLALAVAATLGLAGPAAAAPAAGASLAQDPALVSGVLPNGLRYLILRSATPRGALHLRLAMQVGSLEETEDQRGAAHFIEHLAFHGMPGLDETALDHRFAALGVAFGRDRNAATGFASTVYRLDLPHADAAGVALGLSWLRHVAAGSDAPSAAEVGSERGVIEAEREVRADGDADFESAIRTFVAPDARASRREPIGTPQSLAAMTPQSLQAFRRLWYRPRTAVVIAVGDWPAADIRRRIEATFSGWVDTGPRPPEPPSGRLDLARGLEASTLADPAERRRIAACRVSAPAAQGDAAAPSTLRQEAREQLWAAILQFRLGRQAISARTPLLRATVDSESPDPHALRLVCVKADGGPDGWREALPAVAGEIARLEARGPTDDELADALFGLRARLEAATLPNRQSDAVAAELTEAALAEEPVPAPAASLRAFVQATTDLKPAEVREAFRAAWSGAGPLIVVSDPEAPDAAAVTAAWTRASQRALEPSPPPAMTTAWPYTVFGPPSPVVRRERLQDPDFTRVTFADGVILNVKRVAEGSRDVRIVARFGDGEAGLAPDDAGAALIGLAALPSLGLERIDGYGVARQFGSRPFGATVEPHAFELQARSGPSLLPHTLQLFAAELSDPGFRDLDLRLKAAVGVLQGTFLDQPRLAAASALGDPLGPGGLGSLSGLTTARIQQVLRPRLTRGPVEISIAGDVDEAEAIEMVRATLGALPARGPAPAPDPRAVGSRSLALTAPAEPIRVVHQGPHEKAVALLAWPLFESTSDRVRDLAALDLLTDILAEAVRRDLRERQGKTYSPTAALNAGDDRDQALLEAVVQTAPQDADAAAQAVRRIASSLAAGAITAEDLEAARQPKLARLDAEMQTAAWWAQTLAGSSRTPGRPQARVRTREALASIRLDEVKAAAGAWLARAPWVVIAGPAQ